MFLHVTSDGELNLGREQRTYQPVVRAPLPLFYCFKIFLQSFLSNARYLLSFTAFPLARVWSRHWLLLVLLLSFGAYR